MKKFKTEFINIILFDITTILGLYTADLLLQLFYIKLWSDSIYDIRFVICLISTMTTIYLIFYFIKRNISKMIDTKIITFMKNNKEILKNDLDK